MLYLKKMSFMNNFKNISYFFQMYKINSFSLKSTLKKKEMWLWPMMTVEISTKKSYISTY